MTGEWIVVNIQDYTLVGAATVVTPGYSVLITDSKTGVEYIIYPDGNVYDYIKGSLISVGGIDGLISYVNSISVSGQIIFGNDSNTNISLPDFGSITIPDFNIPSQNGSDFGAGGDQIIIIPPSFQTVEINGEFFNVYGNGSVFSLNGTLVSDQGQQGLISYILVISGQTQIVVTLDYAIVQDTSTGVQYKYYKDSGKVTFMNDTVICETGGLQCLQAWLTEQLKLSSYQNVTTSDGTTYMVYFYGQVTVGATGEVICQTGGI